MGVFHHHIKSSELAGKLKIDRSNFQLNSWIDKRIIYNHIYENIVVPISDGKRMIQIVTNLKKAYESEGKELVRSYEKTSVLATIDEAWKEHLRELDDLRHSVQTATYEQKDPLLIYKFESYELFKAMIDKVNKDVVSILMRGHIPIRDASEVREAESRKKLDMSKYETSKTDVPSYSERSDTAPDRQQQKVQPIRVEKKVGRNDPCPCGSGKKYKQCHGRVGGTSPQPQPGPGARN